MTGKYPHWYHDDGGCEYMDDMCCEEPPMPGKVHALADAHFKDRLLCLLGDEVLFSVDARICNGETQYIKLA